ncbi:MAG: flagellar biosynthesis anti-sigma factor FlgM [Actinomycetota bacterium]|nr:flagellar biosynthesis anti-sigma factor FlgM [Actinomycetota bacterium]
MTLKERLEKGEYRVDPAKVADAILRSPVAVLLLAGDRAPASAPGAAGGPAASW